MAKCSECGQRLPVSVAEAVSDRAFVYETAHSLVRKLYKHEADELPSSMDVLNVAIFLSADERVMLGHEREDE